MPPDVRRLYEETIAKLTALGGRDGVPDVLHGDGDVLKHGTTVRKTFTVNGTTYTDLAAMPPDVRQLYDRAMGAMSGVEPKVVKNEIKMSFELTGPGFHFGKRSGTPAAPLFTTRSSPAPIEPESAAGARLAAFLIAACVLGGLALW